MAVLVYVYAVLGAPVAGQLAGIDEQPVRWIEAGGLAAAVSDVPSDDFDEEPLNDRVRDLSWLGPRAVAHDRVNGLLWERADALVPLAFGTVFRDEAGVRTLLETNAADFKQRLERVRGRGEWVVALRRTQPVASERVGALRAEIAAASAGRAHLLKSRLAEVEREEQARLDAEAVDEFVAEAGRIADGVFVEPLPSQAIEKPLVRATLLVAHRNPAVEGLAERWRGRGFEVEQSGPTPPYRFASLEPAAHA